MDKQPLTYILLKWAVINFFIAALLGLLLRFNMVVPVPGIVAKFWLHAHSHFAMAGWIYTALMGAIFHNFIGTGDKYFRRLFYATLIACYGMLFSFPVKGYWWLSISFSTLYIIITYIFTYAVFKHTRDKRHLVSVKLLRAALLFLCLSSLGAFALGPVMASGKTGSELYFNSIYFYLHFQYNGWFILTIAALLFRYLELRAVPFSEKAGNNFYRLLTLSVFPLYFLSTLWSNPGVLFNILSGTGALLQLAALVVLLALLNEVRKTHKPPLIIVFIFLLVSVKVCFQLPGSWQPLAELAYTYRNFVIAFLHLVMLGIVSFSLFAWGAATGIFRTGKAFRMGMVVYTAGFILSEAIMVAQPLFALNGTVFPSHHLNLFLASALLPAGVALLLASVRKKHNKE